MVNSHYSSEESSSNEENGLPIDSGLEDTEFEYSKPDLLEDNFDDTLEVMTEDDGHEEIDLNDPVERPPEPTVPDERVASSSEEEEPPNEEMLVVTSKEAETTRKISSLLSELVGDHPNGGIAKELVLR